MLVLLGVEKGDSEENASKLAQKLVSLRIFEDSDGKMNKSILDINGAYIYTAGLRPAIKQGLNQTRFAGGIEC